VEFASGAAVRLAWATIVAFLRISTNPRVFERPFTTAEAGAVLSYAKVSPSGRVMSGKARGLTVALPVTRCISP
jgi:hypothetical protein